MSDKDKVILAAVEELRARTLRFTMSDLARRLRMSKTSLYKIVDSKDQLIAEILTYRIDMFNREEKTILAGQQPILEKITLFIHHFLDLIQAFDTSFYDDLQYFYESEWKRWLAFRQEKINVFMQLMQEGVNAGVLRPVNHVIVYQCLSTTMASLAAPDFLRENDLTYAQAIDSLQDIVLHGLLVPS